MKDKKNTMLGIKQYQRANITVCPTVILGRRLYHWHRPRVDIYPYIDSTQSSQKLSLDMLILGPQHFYVT